MSEVTKKMPLEQKAAAVVVALGVDKASRIYQNMPSEQVEQLTYEIARLGNLSMEDTEEILEEFYQLCMTRKAITVGGMEYARTVLEKAFGDQTAHQLLEKITRSLKNQAFSFLRKTEAKDIFSVLQYERPQTIAIVLSYIDPDKAADVIVQLPEEVQIAVVQSIAEMDSVSSSAIKILEEELQKKFTSVFS
ncbi:MAG: flagellar motor switch protein FliG, partial [Butyricicoccus pullicaecorum]|nr:flagellar motor switch protein FliG [Butyricicoccus pullicaecorum]